MNRIPPAPPAAPLLPLPAQLPQDIITEGFYAWACEIERQTVLMIARARWESREPMVPVFERIPVQLGLFTERPTR